MSAATLTIEVIDVHGTRLGDATVAARSPEDGSQVRLDYHPESQTYRAEQLPAGPVDVSVDHGRLQGQARRVALGGVTSALFILGEPGVPTYFREQVRVPIDADPDLIAVTVRRPGPHGDAAPERSGEAALDAAAASLGLVEEKIPSLARRSGMRLFRVPGGPDGIERAVAELERTQATEHVGAVVNRSELGFSHLTRDLVVQFRGPRREEAAAIGKELGCRLVRDLVYAPTTFVFRYEGPATTRLLEVVERFAARDDVAWAEPSLVVSPQVDAIAPSDTLWAGCWDRQLVGAQDAWQRLQDAGLQTFGDPNVLLAVWDSGVQQSGGVPTNGDFAGTLSNGNPKNFGSFDFDNMVANNNAPWDDHGSGVAGVATALANNAAPSGAGYGLPGVAPNVAMLSVVGRTPYVDIEVSDQYLWMAGFDPQSPLPGFPAPLSRGADVITCSLTPGAGAPLSGTARAALDFVTTFGRGGKGTLCFFSTGNANQNNVTARPWGAYQKSFGIAGTSLADDGVTEIRAPFSGWGQIALSAPTQDASPTVHNPPTGYMTWGAAHEGAGNLPSFAERTTSTTGAVAAGATTLTLASVVGLSAGQVIHVGAVGVNGSEPARITAVDPGTSTVTVEGWQPGWGGGLLNAHAAGSTVIQGPPNHTNSFGGTSSATPLAAGVAALVLSARPSLTFVQARQVLRDSAVKLDLANTDPVGQWLDEFGVPSVVSGLPPVRSGWYGYGRVDASAAVERALTFGASADLVLRDNLSDTGSVPSTGAYWDTPDVWCRRTNPAADPGALPASYAAAGPHESPVRGQSNWVYARVHNRGAVASLDAWVRISVAHWPGLEFTWPASFQPTTGPGDPLPTPLAPGTYLIGEAQVSGLAPGAEQIVSVEWPASMIPPATVTVGGSSVAWHPCLLAEITPHDGPLPTGARVGDDNNLAQKNITIVDADAGSDFLSAIVVGHEVNHAKGLVLEVLRGKLPETVQLYVDVVDPVLRRRLRVQAEQQGHRLAETPVLRGPVPIEPPVRLPRSQLRTAVVERALAPLAGLGRRGWRIGQLDGRDVVFLDPMRSVRLPLPVLAEHPMLLLVGGVVGEGTPPGDYEVGLIQRQPRGSVSGAAAIRLRVGRQ